MKNFLKTICSPILNIFEGGDEPYAYKPLNRKILVVIGVLFLGLVSAVGYLSFDKGEPGYLIPVIVFSGIAVVTLIVGLLGSDRAVSKIWGNR